MIHLTRNLGSQDDPFSSPMFASPLVTAIEFDDSGEFLAAGLSSGAVSVYHNKGALFVLFSHFSSHDTQIIRIKWCKGQCNSMLLLASSANSTKLWKITRGSNAHHNMHKDRTSHDSLFAKRSPPRLARVSLKREFNNIPHTHISHIHSVSTNSDGETFLSADELRIRLWNLHAGECFNMLDLAPESLHHLTEVLRVAEFHPIQCNVLAYGTSAGGVRLCDMRDAALCDGTWRSLGGGASHASGSSYAGPLEEYMVGVSDIAFSHSGTHLAARDYGQIRLWDLRVEDRLLASYNVLPRHQLLAHLYDRFEDGAPLDKFKCTFLGGESLRIVTGMYNDECIIWDVDDSSSHRVMHVGRSKFEELGSSPEEDYFNTTAKRRKYDDVDIHNGENHAEDEHGGIGVENVAIHPFGSVHTTPFSGEMKSEYMMAHNSMNNLLPMMRGKNHSKSTSSDFSHFNNGNNNHPPVSFGRKISALAVDVVGDKFAMAATGKLHVYDIKR